MTHGKFGRVVFTELELCVPPKWGKIGHFDEKRHLDDCLPKFYAVFQVCSDQVFLDIFVVLSKNHEKGFTGGVRVVLRRSATTDTVVTQGEPCPLPFFTS